MSTSMKRFTVTLALLVGIILVMSTAAQAQSQRMSVEERVQGLKDSLKLNDQQAAKITKILEDMREEMTTLMSENRDDREAMQTARQASMKKADTQIKEVLSKEQILKYEEMLKGRQGRMGKRMRGGSRP